MKLLLSTSTLTLTLSVVAALAFTSTIAANDHVVHREAAQDDLAADIIPHGNRLRSTKYGTSHRNTQSSIFSDFVGDALDSVSAMVDGAMESAGEMQGGFDSDPAGIVSENPATKDVPESSIFDTENLPVCTLDIFPSPTEALYNRVAQVFNTGTKGLSDIQDFASSTMTEAVTELLPISGPYIRQSMNDLKVMTDKLSTKIKFIKSCIPAQPGINDVLDTQTLPLKLAADGVYEVQSSFRKVTSLQTLEMQLATIFRNSKYIIGITDTVCQAVPKESINLMGNLRDVCEAYNEPFQTFVKVTLVPVNTMARRLSYRIMKDNTLYNTLVSRDYKNATALNSLLLFDEEYWTAKEASDGIVEVASVPSAREDNTSCIPEDTGITLSDLVDKFQSSIGQTIDSVDLMVENAESFSIASQGTSNKYVNAMKQNVEQIKNLTQWAFACLDTLTLEGLGVDTPGNKEDPETKAYRVVSVPRIVTPAYLSHFPIDMIIESLTTLDDYSDSVCAILPGVAEDTCKAIQLSIKLSSTTSQFYLNEMKALIDLKIFVDDTKYNGFADYYQEEAAYMNLITYLRK